MKRKNILSTASALGLACGLLGTGVSAAAQSVVGGVPLDLALATGPSVLPLPVSNSTLNGTPTPGTFTNSGAPVAGPATDPVPLSFSTDPNTAIAALAGTTPPAGSIENAQLQTKTDATAYSSTGSISGGFGGQALTGGYSQSANATVDSAQTVTTLSVPNGAGSFDVSQPTVTSGPTVTGGSVSNVAVALDAQTSITGMAETHVSTGPVLLAAPGSGTTGTAPLTATAGVVSTQGTQYLTATGTATFDATTGQMSTTLDSIAGTQVDSRGVLVGSTSAAGTQATLLSTSGIDTTGSIRIYNGISSATPSVTLSATGLNNGGNTITNVADGVNATDAANVGQVTAAAASAVAAANAYTDTSVSNEATRATAAEGVLQSNIDVANSNIAAETTRATSAEGVLQSNITAGDAATLSSANAYTDTSVSNEATARIAGDVATLKSANAYTDTSVSNEATLRIAGDAATLSSANAYTDTSVSNEATARIAGDAATLKSANAYTDTSVSNEATARIAGDAATLSSANSYTDTSVGNEAARAKTAENALGQAVVAETSRAMSAEAQLGNRINAETARAQAAEAQLDRKINASTAMAAALSGTTFLPNTHFNLSGSVATYHGATAGAVQGAFLVTPHVAVTAGAAFNLGGGASSGNNAIGRVGVTFGW